MPSTDSVSRQRLVAGAADLIRRRGLNATSVRELAKHSGAPLGSTYHYFPEGKDQLATEAVNFAADSVSTLLSRALAGGPRRGLARFIALWRSVLVDSDFEAGCPVLAVSVEQPPAGPVPPYLVAAAAAFDRWQALLSASLRDHGVSAGMARELATLVVASVEGTVAICRAKHSTAALDDIAKRLDSILRDALRSGRKNT